MRAARFILTESGYPGLLFSSRYALKRAWPRQRIIRLISSEGVSSSIQAVNLSASALSLPFFMSDQPFGDFPCTRYQQQLKKRRDD